MPNPFKIAVYDKAYGFKGFIGNPQSVSATPRHNQRGTAAITVAGDHRMVGALTDKGARVVIHHKPWPTKYRPNPSFEFLMSGVVTGGNWAGTSKTSTLTVQIADDVKALDDIFGWPVPTSPISDQSAAAYATYTGPAETILKAVFNANAARALNLTAAPDLGRGAVVPGGVAFRFHSLSEKLLPVLDAAGLGVTVRQSGAGRVLDVYVPRTFPHKLSEKAGTITEASWTFGIPTATREVAGGKGEGTERMFAQYIDTALEDEYGMRVERFKDATDVDTTADLTSRAQQDVADNGPKFGFSVKLSESGMFQYGEYGVRVGDLVTVDIGGQERTDVLRECTLAFNVSEGPTQTPVIGDINESTDKALARYIGRLRAAVNNLMKG
ncbi:Gp37-like protein [Sinomonas susongensis]|uniref:Gp37-like protein n=1 Tax=Sinomonas susongensis TaxID=1324851 RepID=UPI00110849CB|nr:hypothetical protein [Sinomonas susongensis]